MHFSTVFTSTDGKLCICLGHVGEIKHMGTEGPEADTLENEGRKTVG